MLPWEQRLSHACHPLLYSGWTTWFASLWTSKRLLYAELLQRGPRLWERLFMFLWHNGSHLGSWLCSRDSWVFFSNVFDLWSFPYSPISTNLVPNHSCASWPGLKNEGHCFHPVFKEGKNSSPLPPHNQILMEFWKWKLSFLVWKMFWQVRKLESQRHHQDQLNWVLCGNTEHYQRYCTQIIINANKHKMCLIILRNKCNYQGVK